MSGGGVGEDGVEEGLVDGAADRLHLAVGEHDRDRRLIGDLEAGEDVGLGVVDLWERQRVAVGEVDVLVGVTRPRDPDELDLSVPSLLGLLDRGGFTVAGRSPGRPEPEQHGPTGVLTHLDLGAVEQPGAEVERGRYCCRCRRAG